jgi:transcriptional regulator with XRE-family HTH domain
VDVTEVCASIASLGTLIRRRRRELGLTQGEIARRAGLSIGFISQLERGLVSPSLSSMVSIADALGKAPGDFLVQPLVQEPLTKAGIRGRFSVARDGAVLEYERISSSFPGSTMNSILIHVPPGYAGETGMHKGEEIMFVIEGSIKVIVSKKKFILERGDSVHYDAKQPHSYASNSSEMSLVLWVGTLGIFG